VQLCNKKAEATNEAIEGRRGTEWVLLCPFTEGNLKNAFYQLPIAE